MRTTPLAKRALALASAALALAITAASAEAAASGGSRAGAAERRTAATQDASFASLDAAVAAGRVDASVVRTLRAEGEVDALVTFADRPLRAIPPRGRFRELLAELRTEYAEQERDALAEAGSDASVIRPYPNLPVSFVRFDSERALLDVVNAEDVTAVRENARGTAATQQSLTVIRQPTAAAQGRIGTGAVIAVLDTGVEYARAAFGSCPTPGGSCRVALAYEYGDQDGYQDDGVNKLGQSSKHGTNVAGIAAAVAPGAKLISMDVFTRGSYWTSDAINQAVNKLADLKAAGWNIRAMNLSLGESPTYHETACSTHALAAAFKKARDWGILPVVSSGNSAYNADAGVYTRGISSPACIPGALSVGATSDSAHGGSAGSCAAATAVDLPMYFSQSGTLLSMLAPGNCIDAGGIRMQGTSQAAPHVSGAVAVLAAAKPAATIDQIASALINSGPSITDTRFNVSRRRLDLPAALTTLLGSSADTTGPSVTAPVQSLPLNWYLGVSVVPVQLNWSASDASGIAQYDVMFSRDGGAWQRLSLPSATGTSVVVNDLVPGSSYRFIVAAKDGAGNWSGWAYGPAFTVDAPQETSAAIAYSGSWTRLAWASAFGGYQTAATAAGAQATLTFTGRNVAWVAPQSTLGGRAYLYVDGAYVQTVDLYRASTLARNIVFSRSFGAVGTHTVTVYVEGTAGRPQVDVDAFVVLR